MNASIPMLLVSTVAIGIAPTAQTTNKPEVGSRVPVDVSVQELRQSSRRVPGDTTRDGNIGLSAWPSRSALTPLDCLETISDQATAGCLQASSTPVSGMLFPYPGMGNLFQPPSFVGGGEGNHATGPWSTVAGGYDNTASGDYATVGGGFSNRASGSGYLFSRGCATVAGGQSNQATARHSTVGGGSGNIASERYATVAGGFGGTASGNASTVGGGSSNIASERYATVAGGSRGTASGIASTVGGGGGPFTGNIASGDYATIPGGLWNTALGNHSFAAGRRAKANHNGAFVWGDSFDGDKPSSAADEFNVYASGGVRMFTNSAATTGVLLAPGGSTWTMVSDRDAKENVEAVDARAVLGKVAQLPLSTWNYTEQDDSIRHMGPMAQDFYAAFGLGLGDKTIDTIDPNGVALAAIQGLNAELEELRAENEELKAQLSELTSRLDELTATR